MLFMTNKQKMFNAHRFARKAIVKNQSDLSSTLSYKDYFSYAMKNVEEVGLCFAIEDYLLAKVCGFIKVDNFYSPTGKKYMSLDCPVLSKRILKTGDIVRIYYGGFDEAGNSVDTVYFGTMQEALKSVLEYVNDYGCEVSFD